jgi:hypothetical protein
MFVKGKQKTGGKKKGSRNKATLLMQFDGMTESDKRKVFNAAMKLVKSGNVTIIAKLIDKMLPNLQPQEFRNPFESTKPKTLKIEFV